jgi:hypothetical protein
MEEKNTYKHGSPMQLWGPNTREALQSLGQGGTPTLQAVVEQIMQTEASMWTALSPSVMTLKCFKTLSHGAYLQSQNEYSQIRGAADFFKH